MSQLLQFYHNYAWIPVSQVPAPWVLEIISWQCQLLLLTVMGEKLENVTWAYAKDLETKSK